MKWLGQTCHTTTRSRTLDCMTDSSRNTQAPTVVTVYPMTGRQLFFNVPHAVCEECDLTVRLVKRVASDLPTSKFASSPDSTTSSTPYAVADGTHP